MINGPNLLSPLIDKFCSSHKPEVKSPFHTSGSEAIIIFKSDKSQQSSGFKLNWQSDEGGCGNQMLQSDTGSFTSPGYPKYGLK